MLHLPESRIGHWAPSGRPCDRPTLPNLAVMNQERRRFAPPQAARSGTPYGRAAWAPVPSGRADRAARKAKMPSRFVASVRAGRLSRTPGQRGVRVIRKAEFAVQRFSVLGGV